MKTAVAGGGSSGAGGSVISSDLPIALKDEDYFLFAKVLNSHFPAPSTSSGGGSPERIASNSFKRGLLKYGLVSRDEDAHTVCLEISPSGGDLLVSAIRAKIVGRDPKLSNLLKRFIRTVLDHQQGSTRDRVLGKIISRAGETMAPEINLLRSSMGGHGAYKYIEDDSTLLDIKEDVIEVVPPHSSTPDPSPSSGQRSYFPAVADPPARSSIHVAPSSHSSSRDRVLGKIISSAVSTVSLDKPAAATQLVAATAPDLTPKSATRGVGHSARDKVLAKIISSAVSAAGGASQTPPPSDPQPHLSSSSHSKYSPAASAGPQEVVSDLERLETSGGVRFDLRRSQELRRNDDCALQDYTELQDYTDDQPLTQRRSFADRAQNQGSQLEPRAESRRRVTYDPEKHSSLYQSTPSNEYFQVDLMDTQNDNRQILDRELGGSLSRADSRPRRHSENSISDSPELAGHMQLIREKERRLAEDLPYQLSRSPSKRPPPVGGGRVRNKILTRMVNRVRGSMLSEAVGSLERPSSGRRDAPPASGEPALKEKKSPSPRIEPRQKWFHGSTVAIDNSCSEQRPREVRSPTAWDPTRNLRIQTLDSRAEGDGDFKESDSPPRRESDYERRERSSSSSSQSTPNPLRHILSDARLVIPPSDASFSPGSRFKASPVHLTVSTPQQPYRETYRRTVNLYPSPEERALTPEPYAESVDGVDELLSPSAWSKESAESGSKNPNPQTLRDKWVGAAPVQLGGASEPCHRTTSRTLPKKVG
jgi:hypothetical protein